MHQRAFTRLPVDPYLRLFGDRAPYFAPIVGFMLFSARESFARVFMHRLCSLISLLSSAREYHSAYDREGILLPFRLKLLFPTASSGIFSLSLDSTALVSSIISTRYCTLQLMLISSRTCIKPESESVGLSHLLYIAYAQPPSGIVEFQNV